MQEHNKIHFTKHVRYVVFLFFIAVYRTAPASRNCSILRGVEPPPQPPSQPPSTRVVLQPVLPQPQVACRRTAQMERLLRSRQLRRLRRLLHTTFIRLIGCPATWSICTICSITRPVRQRLCTVIGKQINISLPCMYFTILNRGFTSRCHRQPYASIYILKIYLVKSDLLVF